MTSLTSFWSSALTMIESLLEVGTADFFPKLVMLGGDDGDSCSFSSEDVERSGFAEVLVSSDLHNAFKESRLLLKKEYT